jgi:hypothetical protein
MGLDKVTTPAPAGASAGRFLAELATAWSILRLYRRDLPAFRRCIEAAAQGLKQSFCVHILPQGFLEGSQTVAESEAPLAERLHSMALLSISIQAGLSADQLSALVLLLDKAFVSGPKGQALAESIAAATNGQVAAEAIRLSELNLVEGTEPANPQENPAARWQALFKTNSGAAAQEFADSFEQSMQGVSPERQQQLIDAWRTGLASIEKPTDARNAAATDTAGQIDVVSSFLQSLSPDLSKRLIGETIADDSVPQDTAASLADKLPTGVVLSALATVQRNNAAPSAAALAMLRKVSAHLKPSVPDNRPPVSNEEFAQAAAELERILSTSGESRFVPDEYLARRKQLSEQKLAKAKEAGQFRCPDERETCRHAAEMVLDLLSSADNSIQHITTSLEFLKRRLSNWIRTGEFLLASEVITTARRLSAHADANVAAMARQIHEHALDADDLMGGASQCYDRRKAGEAIADLLRISDPSAVARLLVSDRLDGATPGDNVLMTALSRCLANDKQATTVTVIVQCVKDDAPKALVTLLMAMEGNDAVANISAALAAGSAKLRQALLQAMMRRKAPLPLPLIEQMLKDADANTRRVAMMRLVRDNDLATSAKYFQAAMSGEAYPPDVASSLAELLQGQKSDPALREAFSAWRWSGRRWGGMLGLGSGKTKKAG